MRLSRCSNFAFFALFLLSGSPAFAEPEILNGRPHPRECISSIDYYPERWKGNQERLLRELKKEDVIKTALGQRKQACSEMLKSEVFLVQRNPKTHYPNHCAIASRGDGIKGTSLQFKDCPDTLTAMDMIEKNAEFKSLYQAVVARDEETVKAKAAEAEHDKVVRSIKKFSLKDVYLGIGKESLFGPKTPGGRLSCRPGNEVDTQEICDFYFVTSTTKDCERVVYKNLALGEFSPGHKCANTATYIDKYALPDNLAKLSTIGGEKVRLLSAVFYQNKLYSFTMVVPGTKELFQAVVNKYGQPNEFDHGDIWNGESEWLQLNKEHIRITDKNVLQAVKDKSAARAETQKTEAERLQLEKSKQKVNDF